jgi:hypothetical protein
MIITFQARHSGLDAGMTGFRAIELITSQVFLLSACPGFD